MKPKTHVVVGVMLLAQVAAAQTVTCGNAFYDDGVPRMGWEGDAGDPHTMFGVRFSLSDFGYGPGRVAIAGFCAADVLWYDPEPSEVFIYPDDNGRPDTSVVLGRGTIHTEPSPSVSIVMLDAPVVLHGDFWLVARGWSGFAGEMHIEGDAEPDGGHSYYSYTGINGLTPISDYPSGGGDFSLRAYLQPVRRPFWTGGVAHTSGEHNTEWRTKLTVLNTAEAPNRATLSYLYGSSAVPATIELGAGELRAWDDVVADLFGVANESSGAIRIDADEPVVVNARTFNASAQGTFGQSMPAVEPGDAMGFGQVGRLPLLSNTSAFRTNVGFLNLGDSRAEVRITLHDASGAVLGSTRLQVPAGRWRQLNDVFGAVGAGEVADGYATVELLSEGGSVWGCASVIDNASGDPTMVPLAIE
jgi:hypothetical protein